MSDAAVLERERVPQVPVRRLLPPLSAHHRRAAQLVLAQLLENLRARGGEERSHTVSRGAAACPRRLEPRAESTRERTRKRWSSEAQRAPRTLDLRGLRRSAGSCDGDDKRDVPSPWIPRHGSGPDARVLKIYLVQRRNVARDSVDTASRPWDKGHASTHITDVHST